MKALYSGELFLLDGQFDNWPSWGILSPSDGIKSYNFQDAVEWKSVPMIKALFKSAYPINLRSSLAKQVLQTLVNAGELAYTRKIVKENISFYVSNEGRPYLPVFYSAKDRETFNFSDLARQHRAGIAASDPNNAERVKSALQRAEQQGKYALSTLKVNIEEGDLYVDFASENGRWIILAFIKHSKIDYLHTLYKREDSAKYIPSLLLESALKENDHDLFFSIMDQFEIPLDFTFDNKVTLEKHEYRPKNSTLQQQAVIFGSQRILTTLTDKHGLSLEVQSADGFSLQHLAAIFDHQDMLSYLLEERMLNPNVTSTAGYTLLHAAYLSYTCRVGRGQGAVNWVNVQLLKYAAKKLGVDPEQYEYQMNRIKLWNEITVRTPAYLAGLKWRTDGLQDVQGSNTVTSIYRASDTLERASESAVAEGSHTIKP